MYTTRVFKKVHDASQRKIDSAKVDDKKEYWQKYREKEEEIELDKDEKDDKIPNTKHVV